MINIKGLHKQFDQLEVLKGIDLEVKKGQVVVVIGPSGSGKTTFFAVHQCAGGDQLQEFLPLVIKFSTFPGRSRKSKFHPSDALQEWCFKTITYSRI